ncbi:glycosyltransferase family 2 protein [Pseudoalteromonas mariniglutinosa]|uniref:glycosyltransferase family 2 protein n=1 Tax=Pseudoalteromonas mariniglutinosa TaxID=206042 RepID=UPI00384CB6C2
MSENHHNTCSKLPISVFIVTLNEAKFIEKTLNSVRQCAEVIIVDSGSTDGTVEIATRLGAKVIYNPWQGYAKQKQIAMEHCHFDWVLNLDGDEELTSSALEALCHAMENDSHSAVRLKRIDRFIGRFPSEWVKKPNNVRFYKKRDACFDKDKLVHESAHVKGDELYLQQHFLHYGYDDIDTLDAKYNTYSTLRAEEKVVQGKCYSLLKLLAIFPLTFIKEYILCRFFLFGVRGFIKSMMAAHYAFLKEAKLYERNQKSNNKALR